MVLVLGLVFFNESFALASCGSGLGWAARGLWISMDFGPAWQYYDCRDRFRV